MIDFSQFEINHAFLFLKCPSTLIFVFNFKIMPLYNETIGIDKDVEQEWLHWMKSVYMPAMMGTGMFSDSKIYRIQHDNDDGTLSYSVQYFSPSIENIQKYLDVYAQIGRASCRERV